MGLFARNKFFLGFMAVVVGLFLYAGLTGNYGFIPRFELPFGRQVQPGSQTLSAPILYPQLTGSVGFNASQLVKRFERFGGKIEWERSDDNRGWIMRYTIPVELTQEIATGAARFNFLADASQAGISGPGLHAVQWTEDGYLMSPNELNYFLSSIAIAMRQDGDL